MISHFFTAPCCRGNCTFWGQSHQDSNSDEATNHLDLELDLDLNLNLI